MKKFCLRIAAPVLALLYPFSLAEFHVGMELAKSTPEAGTLLAVSSICIAFAIPLIALLSFTRLAAIGEGGPAPTVATLGVACPTIFTFAGVVLYMLHYPVPELPAWVAGWGTATVLAALPIYRKSRGVLPTAKLRSIHGVLAASAVVTFLGFHMFNHLVGLAGGDTHTAVMKVGRRWYRAAPIEPILVLTMLSIAATGAVLLWRRLRCSMDGFLALQAASGTYLLFFVIGHMNSVFIYARRWLGIDTDWSFATGAPTDLISDDWNIRLVPHYALGVFFLLVHLAGGLRIVMLAHGVTRPTGDRVMIFCTGLAALIAASIVVGMCGVQIFPGSNADKISLNDPCSLTTGGCQRGIYVDAACRVKRQIFPNK